MEEVNVFIHFFFILRTLIEISNSLRVCLFYDRATSSKEICLKDKRRTLLLLRDNEVEITTKVEYVYEDTRVTTRVEPDYKWGEIYQMISNKEVSDVGFEELTIYANI